jgi:hypothetical protein
VPYFKVYFQNNNAIIAERISGLLPIEIIHISQESEKRTVEWIVVNANDDEHAKEEAIVILRCHFPKDI